MYRFEKKIRAVTKRVEFQMKLEFGVNVDSRPRKQKLHEKEEGELLKFFFFLYSRFINVKVVVSFCYEI